MKHVVPYFIGIGEEFGPDSYRSIVASVQKALNDRGYLNYVIGNNIGKDHSEVADCVDTASHDFFATSFLGLDMTDEEEATAMRTANQFAYIHQSMAKLNSDNVKLLEFPKRDSETVCVAIDGYLKHSNFVDDLFNGPDDAIYKLIVVVPRPVTEYLEDTRFLYKRAGLNVNYVDTIMPIRFMFELILREELAKRGITDEQFDENYSIEALGGTMKTKAELDSLVDVEKREAARKARVRRMIGGR